MSFYCIFSYISHKHLFEFIFNKLIFFKTTLCSNYVHDRRWSKSSSFRNEMLQQQTCRDDKGLGCRWTQTSLKQRRCCSSHCCSIPGGTANEITCVLIDKAREEQKDYDLRFLKIGDTQPHTYEKKKKELSLKKKI